MPRLGRKIEGRSQKRVGLIFFKIVPYTIIGNGVIRSHQPDRFSHPAHMPMMTISVGASPKV